MVYTQEYILSWFKELHGFNRIDVMCNLLNMCLPFELRFLGTCIENLGKKDYLDLREAENKANSNSELELMSDINDDRTRRKLILYVSLLKTTNHVCSNIIFKLLSNGDSLNTFWNVPIDTNTLDELLLLYTLAANHPAFTFDQRTNISDILIRLIDIERSINCSKIIQCHPVTGPIQFDYANKVPLKPFTIIPNLNPQISSGVHQGATCQCPMSYTQNELILVTTSPRQNCYSSGQTSLNVPFKDTILANAEVESCPGNSQDILYKLTLYWQDGSVKKLLVTIANLNDLHVKLMQHPMLKMLPSNIKLPQFPGNDSVIVPVIHIREYLMKLLTQSSIVRLPPVAEFLNFFCEENPKSSQISSGKLFRTSPTSENLSDKSCYVNGHYQFKPKQDVCKINDVLLGDLNTAKHSKVSATHVCNSTTVTYSTVGNSRSDPTFTSVNSSHLSSLNPIGMSGASVTSVGNCVTSVPCGMPLVKGHHNSYSKNPKPHISDSTLASINCTQKNAASQSPSACNSSVRTSAEGADCHNRRVTEANASVANSGLCVTVNHSWKDPEVSINAGCNSVLPSKVHVPSEKVCTAEDKSPRKVLRNSSKDELYELIKKDRLKKYWGKLLNYSVSELKSMTDEELRKLSLPNHVINKLRKILCEVSLSSSPPPPTVNGVVCGSSLTNGTVSQAQIYTVSELTTVPNPKATLSIQPLPNPNSHFPTTKSHCFRGSTLLGPVPMPVPSYFAVNCHKYSATVHQSPLTMTNHTPITTVAPSQFTGDHRGQVDIVSPSKCNSDVFCPADNSPSCSEGSSPAASPIPDPAGDAECGILSGKLYSSLRIQDEGNCESPVTPSLVTSPVSSVYHSNLRTQTGYYFVRSVNPGPSPNMIRTEGFYRNRPVKTDCVNSDCVLTSTQSPAVTSSSCVQTAPGSRETSPSSTPPAAYNQSPSIMTTHYPLGGFHNYPGFVSPPPSYYPLTNGLTPDMVFGGQFQLLQPHSSSQSYMRPFPGSYISVPSVYVQNSAPGGANKGKSTSCFNCGQAGHRGNECMESTIEDITRPGHYRLDYTPVSKQKS